MPLLSSKVVPASATIARYRFHWSIHMHLCTLMAKGVVTCVLCTVLSSTAIHAQVKWYVIDSITPTVYVHNLTVTGNKRTKEGIIAREFIIHKNDTLTNLVMHAAVQRTMENVMNTGLFNFVEIHVTPFGNYGADITVIVKEKWYVWPFPILEGVDRNLNEWWQTKDFSRINYGMYLLHENFRGRKENLQLNARFGYSLKLGVTYSIPFIDKNKTQGLAFSAGTQRFREIPIALQSNQLIFYSDQSDITKRESYAWVRYTQRKNLYQSQNVFAEFRDIILNDSVAILNNNFLRSTDNHVQMLMIGASYRYEKVDFNVYPLTGIVYSAEAIQNGLALLRNEPAVLTLNAGLRYFTKFAPRWYHAISVRAKYFSQPAVPFYLQRGLGYGNDFVRGYELFVVNGNWHTIAKSNVKYVLVPQQKFKIKFIRTEKFNTIPFALYINCFADAAYAHSRFYNETNTLNNKLLAGVGAGVDVVSYYNIVWRFEYAFTLHNTQGFFIHFSSPI